jgi:hypothetical protein
MIRLAGVGMPVACQSAGQYLRSGNDYLRIGSPNPWVVSHTRRFAVSFAIALAQFASSMVVQAIREVVRGGAVLTPKVASKVMRAMPEQPHHPQGSSHLPQADDLTLRELEVLECSAKACATKASPST